MDPLFTEALQILELVHLADQPTHSVLNVLTKDSAKHFLVGGSARWSQDGFLDVRLELLNFLLELAVDAIVEDAEHIVLLLNILTDIQIVFLPSKLLPVIHTWEGLLVGHRCLKPLNKSEKLAD